MFTTRKENGSNYFEVCDKKLTKQELEKLFDYKNNGREKAITFNFIVDKDFGMEAILGMVKLVEERLGKEIVVKIS